MLSWSEIIPEFVEGATEALRGSKTFKTQHGIVTLFNAAVILLDPVIFIAATPVLHLPEHFGDGPWIRIVSVGGDLFGTASGDGLSTAEEALGRRHVPLGTEHRIDQLPLFVNGSIEIAPAAVYLK